MKKFLVLGFFLVNFFSLNAIAGPQTMGCGHAAPIGSDKFCSTFKAIAYCHCHDEHHMPPKACSDMGFLYQLMIDTYGSLANGCSTRVQKDVSQQECMDNWNFYRSHCPAL